MKNGIVVIICLAILGISGYLVYDEFILICDYPVKYSIGTFDNHFSITKDQLLRVLKEAEAVWESPAGVNLFDYDPMSSFSVNLIYDERQKITDSANVSEMNIEGTRATYDLLYKQYLDAKSDYFTDVTQYQFDVNQYEQRLDSYNAKVAQINAKGGAKPSEAKELESERSYLQSEINRLENQRQALNSEVDALNSLGARVSALATKFNIQIDIYNEEFGQSRQFDQGDYQGDRINIYQFETTNDLRMVLAHEFGHALGLDHISNPKSIMYYLMGEQNIVNPKPSSEDLFALRTVCGL